MFIFFTLIIKNNYFISRKEVLSINEIKNDEYKLKIFIPESVYNTTQYSNYAIATYCLLKALCHSSIVKHCITPSQLVYYLTENEKYSKRLTNYMKCGLDELIENNIVGQITMSQKKYILDCTCVWFDTENEKYTVVYFYEIQRIFKVENINNFLLMRFFIYLIGTLSSSIEVYIDTCQSKTRVVGNLTIDFIAQKSGISTRSVIEYTKILEEIGLLYVKRQSDFIIDKDNNIRQLTNVYGRPDDKDYIDAFASNQQKHKESYRYVKKSVGDVNNNRRLAQMYNQIVKKIDNDSEITYSKVEIQTIYDYVISENKKYEKLYEKNNYEEYLDKIRDVDIFKEFDFIKEGNS